METTVTDQMTMEDIRIEGTKKTPLVEFQTNGKLVMKGSAYAENARAFFDPIIAWIENFSSNTVILDLYLDYINTSSAKKLFEMLKKLELNSNLHNVTVNWIYEEGDEDNLETGQILKDSMSALTFKLIPEKS